MIEARCAGADREHPGAREQAVDDRPVLGAPTSRTAGTFGSSSTTGVPTSS